MNVFAPSLHQPFLASMPKRIGGSRFLVELSDAIAREVFFTGQYEPQETALTSAILRPGMTFVDVGANWGYYSLMAAGLVGCSGFVVSLEPHPRLFFCLNQNRLLNDYVHLIILPLAAAQEHSEVFLNGYEEALTNRGLSRVISIEESSDDSYCVRADSLDSILDEHEIERVDLLKMDIEGGELSALKGMAEGLASQRYDRVLLELHPESIRRNRSTIQQCVQPLVNNGYRGYLIDHSKETTRRFAYSRLRRLGVHHLLSQFDESSRLGSWPHTLWFRPGLEGTELG